MSPRLGISIIHNRENTPLPLDICDMTSRIYYEHGYDCFHVWLMGLTPTKYKIECKLKIANQHFLLHNITLLHQDVK